jgi:hypothetical protein
MSLFDTINAGGSQLLGFAWPTVWAIVRILVVSVVILLCVAYLILWERKLIGWMHVRLGPNRVGPGGLLQPIADVLKLLLKEVIQPSADPYRVTAVVQPTGHASGRALAELMLRLLGDGVREQRLEAPAIEAGDTDGPLRG